MSLVDRLDQRLRPGVRRVAFKVLYEGGGGGAQRQRPGIGVAVDVAGVGEDVAERLIIQAAQCQ